ncbi:hypothetical protein FJ250_09745 [bacterium]|nr:hypothetical protein [bacterium]
MRSPAFAQRSPAMPGRRALLILSLLTGACAQSPLGPAPDPDSRYLPYDTPDGLVENFARSWRQMDLAEYSDRVLYDGNLPAVDGERYRPFVFYNEPGFAGAATLDYPTELKKAASIFSGEHGRMPGVAAIELTLTRVGAWSELPAGGTLAGDRYPPGCLRARFDAVLVLRLRPGHPTRGDLSALRAARPQELAVIPVAAAGWAGERPVYRLWKWWELATAE